MVDNGSVLAQQKLRLMYKKLSLKFDNFVDSVTSKLLRTIFSLLLLQISREIHLKVHQEESNLLILSETIKKLNLSPTPTPFPHAKWEKFQSILKSKGS